MFEGVRVRGELVLSAVLIAVGLVLELLLTHARAVGFGVISGGWALLVLSLVRARTARRLRG